MPRALLIEDDESIARFVGMALEELDLELLQVASLAAARAALSGPRAGAFDLVITDLMLPDGSAAALLEEGRARVPGAPPWLVFSAGLAPERVSELQRLGARACLHKPVALGALLAAVQAALGDAPEPPPAPTPVDPVATHFGGDRALFEAFRTGCLARFAEDLHAGQAACDQGDAAALRRVAHGLKAVLILIGEPTLSATARDLEEHCAAGPLDAACRSGWQQLAGGLTQLGP